MLIYYIALFFNSFRKCNQYIVCVNLVLTGFIDYRYGKHSEKKLMRRTNFSPSRSQTGGQHLFLYPLLQFSQIRLNSPNKLKPDGTLFAG